MYFPSNQILKNIFWLILLKLQTPSFYPTRKELKEHFHMQMDVTRSFKQVLKICKDTESFYSHFLKDLRVHTNQLSQKEKEATNAYWEHPHQSSRSKRQ